MTPDTSCPALPATEQTQPPRLDARQLFQGGLRELLIEHEGECYRLRITRQNKLILTK